MINSIRFKFGRARGMKHTEFDVTPVTVFVGPNNSGKSKVLSEIQRYCTRGMKVENDLILDELVFNKFTVQSAEENMEYITLKPNNNEVLQTNNVIVGKRGSRMQVPKAELLQALQQPNAHTNLFCAWYLSYNTIILDGKSRIDLINKQKVSDLQQPSHSSFQVLFSDNDKRKKVRRIVHDAFNSYFVIDPH